MSLCDRSSALGRNYGREQKRDEAVTAAVTAADVTGTNPSDTAGSYGMFAYLCINQSINHAKRPLQSWTTVLYGQNVGYSKIR